jgi:cytochrome c553
LGEGVKKNPVLAGLKSAVFIERMNLYKSGAGDDKIMATFARSLSDEDLVELARYYESLGAKSPE